MPKSSNLRAETARRNGAQSRGPKTEEGLHRSQSARLRHGIYATRCFTLPGEPQAQFLALQAEIRAYWQPTGALPAMLVEQLVGNLWSTQRLLAAKTEHVLDHRVSVASANPALRDDMKLNLMAELSTLVAGGTRERANAELNHLSRERERLTRELLRLEKRPATSGSSQMSLIINNRQHPDIPASDDAEPVEGTIFEMPYAVKATNEPVPASFCEPAPAAEGPAPEPTPESAPEAEKEPAAPILAWAQENLDFTPDPAQIPVLSEQSTRILLLAPRQTGKTTIAAVRIAHEAATNDDALILLASASGRQSGQLLQKTRAILHHAGAEFSAPPLHCDGFTLANGSQVIALPDNPETIRGFSAPRLIVVDEAAFASREVFAALEPMMTVSGGTILLISTPNGQTGYFYDQWHNDSGPWARHQMNLQDCPRVDRAAIDAMRQTMSREQFDQEFLCKFVASGTQFISTEVYRKCLRDDFELFFPEDELSPENADPFAPEKPKE